MDLPVITLELSEGENLEKELFRIKKGYRVKFKPGPSLYGCNIRIYTNLPKREGDNFIRTKYRLLEDNILTTNRAGSFHFYFVNVTADLKEHQEGEGYILVEPTLKLGKDDLPLDCVQCITVLSKCLGPLSTWNERLSIAAESGYNMVHFTPVQKLGNSNSSYSISDQLSLDPRYSDASNNSAPTMNELEHFIENLRQEYKMLSICDIVLNHTATEGVWLRSHPECAYNLVNSPHLRPAYFLDRLLTNFSNDIAKGDYVAKGIPADIDTEEHLQALRYHLGSVVIPAAKIPEFYLIDTQKFVLEFNDRCFSSQPSKNPSGKECQLKIIQDPCYRRLTSIVDMDLALGTYNVYRSDCFDEDTRKRKCAESFKKRLEQLNDAIRKEIEDHLSVAVENTIAQVRYFRVQKDGPRLGRVRPTEPLVPRYFVDRKTTTEETMYDEKEAVYIMAHNGWVMDYDPLKNFAEPGSNIYLRRELIPWTDSVKLRYGEKRDDCPFLWDHMERYVVGTARIFDGVRLDNSHSTPIPVAQYMLDAARNVKPDLYVVAELFTNSDLTDNVFVNKLGITSLIRECMSAWDSHEVGRLVYRYGGWSIGSLSPPNVAAAKIAHAMFIDQTHDNQSSVLVRSVFDLLPSAALVCMASCAVGSTMGYDQLVPHQIDVVKEDRLYMTKNEMKGREGISRGKFALNKLHTYLVKGGYDQIFVDQVDKEIVCVTRQNPRTLDTVLLFAYNSFNWPDECSSNGVGKGINVDGIAQSVILEAWLDRINKDESWYTKTTDHFRKDANYINGLDDYKLELKQNLSVEECRLARIAPCGLVSTRIDLTDEFRPGAVLAIKVVNRTEVREAATKLYDGINEQYLKQALENMNLIHINHVLFKCNDEEEGGSYDVPNFGKLVYCGLQGIMSVLDKVFKNDDLGHPICDNIRNGPWLGEYTANRLKKDQGTSLLGYLLEQNFKLVESIPRGYRPWGMYRILSQVYNVVIRKAYSLMSKFVKEGDDLVKELSLVSVQMCGAVSSAPLPPLSERISAPKLNIKEPSITLAAGLPHFSSGYMRCWGRDTFISLRGLLLLTGRFDEARYLILAFGGCLRHGLIPNLLNGGDLNPRYNCRDAIWWWLYSIKEYCNLAPNGYDILKEPVNRLFPKDDDLKPIFQDQDLHIIMQEALDTHFQGHCFRERNAGQSIDQHMTSKGFDNQIGVHPNTGFVFGGNEWNCGTWMDKMGSSIEAGTKGRPSTSRDGAAIEIVGLSMAVLNWLNKISPDTYPYSGVTRISKAGDKIFWSWQDWINKIQFNFKLKFYIPKEQKNQQANDNDKYIHKRGICKDTCGAAEPWSDYRLRPNFLISLVLAPELYSRSESLSALDTASLLTGPLGMKTLDPDDLAYSGNYDNGNNSSDFRVAHGFNYHQGPEWLWPTGYYLRALLMVKQYSPDSVDETKRWLGRLWSALRESDWRGLPELTNENGAFCRDSCPTQAWSAATILEVLYDLHRNKIDKTM